MPRIPFRLSRQRRLRATPTTATSHQPAHGRNARTTSTGQTLVAGGTRQVRAAAVAKPARQAVTGTVRAGAHTLPPAKKTRGTVPGAVKPKKRTRALGQMRRSISNDRAQHTNQHPNPAGRCRPHRVRAQDFDAPLNRNTGPDAQREAMRAADHATTDRENAEITRRQRAQAHKEQAQKRRYLSDFLTDPDSITSRRTPTPATPAEPARKRRARKRPDPAAEKRRQRRNTDPEHTDPHPGRGSRRRRNTPTVTPTTTTAKRTTSRSNPRAAAVDRRARRHQTAKQARAARQQAAQEAAQQRRQERQAAEQRRRQERRKVTAARRR